MAVDNQACPEPMIHPLECHPIGITWYLRYQIPMPASLALSTIGLGGLH